MSDTNGNEVTAAEIARRLTTPRSLRLHAGRLRRAFDGDSDPGAASEVVEALVALGVSVTFSLIPPAPDDGPNVLVTFIRQPLVMQANGETVEEALARAALALAEMGGLK